MAVMKDPFDRILAGLSRRVPRDPGRSCPDEAVLGAYAEGSLGPEARRELESHLVECRQCRTVVMESGLSHQQCAEHPVRMPNRVKAGVLGEIPQIRQAPLVVVIYRAGKGFFQRLASTGNVMILEPAPVRGKKPIRAYSVDLNDYTVQVTTDRRQDGLFELWLHTSRGEVPIPRGEWQLWSGDRLVEQRPTEGGEALFGDLSPGSHRCVLCIGGSEVGAIHLTIEE